MLSQKEKYDFCDIEWITEEVVKKYQITECYDSSLDFFNKKLRSEFGKLYNIPYRKLTKGEIEITLQHIDIYKRIVNENLTNCIIFEDDVVIKENFRDNLMKCLKILPKDFDIFYFGQGCFQELDFDINAIKEKYFDSPFTVFKKEDKQSRFSDSYVISRKAAEKILGTIIPFCLPIDWELNYQPIIHNMNIYWVYPTLTYQGSGFGIYPSNLYKSRKWKKLLQKLHLA